MVNIGLYLKWNNLSGDIMIKRITKYVGKISYMFVGFSISLFFGYIVGTVVYDGLVLMNVLSESFFNNDDVYMVDKNEKVIIWYSMFSMIILSRFIFGLKGSSFSKEGYDFHDLLEILFSDKRSKYFGSRYKEEVDQP